MLASLLRARTLARVVARIYIILHILTIYNTLVRVVYDSYYILPLVVIQ